MMSNQACLHPHPSGRESVQQTVGRVVTSIMLTATIAILFALLTANRKMVAGRHHNRSAFEYREYHGSHHNSCRACR